ncbi:MAG: DUF721 domain-containing protein [Gemmobacter sp.]
MPRPTAPSPPITRRMRGFEPAAGLLQERIRTAGESRGFAVSRLLTHWAEIAGADIAGCTRPVKMGYGREGIGATLTLLTSGPMAPMIEMQKETIRARVNACYGYNAVSRVTIVQTAATGFAEGQTPFDAAPKTVARPAPDPAVTTAARAQAAGVGDDGLRQALETLAGHVLSRPKSR